MAQPTMTTVFSICLIPSGSLTETVKTIRQDLPPSPYHDDPPHMTLLQKINSPAPVSDERLIQGLTTILQPSEHLPLTAEVEAIVSWPDPIFKYFSSSVALKASGEMKAYRKYIVSELRQAGFSVDPIESVLFLPHVTIRLGVPLQRSTRGLATTHLHKGERLSFNTWSIFRLMKDRHKRLIHEVKPQ
jgi:2'-5' RNA ligase